MSSNNSNDEDNALFRTFVNDITPLNTQTIEHAIAKPNVHIKKQIKVVASNHMTKDVIVHNSDTFFAFHLSKKIRKNFKLGNVSFDASLDLHGHTVLQSERQLVQFINDCHHQNIKYAIIVHGQGHNSEHGSVLKPAVLYWLSQQETIDAYCPAQLRDGGKGASYILISG